MVSRSDEDLISAGTPTVRVGINYFVDLDFVRRWGGKINPVSMGMRRPIPERQKQLA